MQLVPTLAVIFTIISAIILTSAYRSPILRKMGFRNIKRRWGNTVLVVIGSMVGAALISGSLVLGDSLDKSFLKGVEKNLGEIDAFIIPEEKTPSSALFARIDNTDYEQVKQLLGKKDIDGILPGITFITSPQKLDSNGNPVINTFQVRTIALDFKQLAEFGQEPQKINKPSVANGIVASQSLAKKLDLKTGDRVRAFYGIRPVEFEVSRIAEDKGMLGNNTFLVDIAYLTQQLGMPQDSYNIIVISAKGGIRPDNYSAKDFEKKLNDPLDKFNSSRIDLSVDEEKEQALSGYGLKFFLNIFIVLSLFGIISGVLLIINLFSMLAEERKYEMGILRAIALTRFQLMRTFVYEGFVYSIISSFVGAFVGVGIGYLLATVFSNLFKEILAVADQEDAFQIVFGFKLNSLLIAFLLGALITILTSLLASFRISKLNIVSAIRNIPEEKINKVTFGWVIRTGLVFLLLLNGIFTLMGSFAMEDAFQNVREQKTQEQNYFQKMTDAEFKDFTTMVSAYTLYVGTILTIMIAAWLIVRISGKVFNKEWGRPIFSVASIAALVFTNAISEIHVIAKALEKDSAIGLVFASSMVLVVSLAILIGYNLSLFSWLADRIFSRFGELKSIFLLSLRYPNVNRFRTITTLTMFALVIYLIVFISIEKSLVKDILDKAVGRMLGDYNVIITPNSDLETPKVEEIADKVAKVDGIDGTAVMTHTKVIMPKYKYKDLKEKPFYGNSMLLGNQDPEDYYQTTLSGLTEDFINGTEIKIRERLPEYKSDEEMWAAVIKDPNKIVLGEAFVSEGYGKRPDIKVGDEIIVADIFNQKQIKKKVIGSVTPTNNGPEMNMFAYLITTKQNAVQGLGVDYSNKYSSKILLAKTADGADKSAVVKEVKKQLINENIFEILEFSEILGASLGFINGLFVMLQGFLAFSLVVGTSGLAIIMTRSVQERRQQIGMMRSLGFQRYQVLMSFFIESTFITFLAIFVGVSMGLLGMNILIEIQKNIDPEFRLIVNWNEIWVICALVYLFSLVFSLIPSIRASRLSPVEATNYPE